MASTALCLTLLLTGSIRAVSEGTQARGEADHPAIVAASRLQHAFAEGDAVTLRSLLSPDVLIFEAGGVESSRDEYESHHMESDMAFMASIDGEVLSRKIIESGNTAVVMTRSRLSGNFKDKEIDLSSTETLVMENTDGGWKIRHIHWSSR
jgi:ketosteroid isomerase-like protein